MGRISPIPRKNTKKGKLRKTDKIKPNKEKAIQTHFVSPQKIQGKNYNNNNISTNQLPLTTYH